MRKFLGELLDASGEVISHYFHKRTFNIEQKANKTPVTLADRETEQVMRKMIRDRFPHHGIIGEEYGTENDGAEYVWVLDPIDGTIAFIHGVPLFVTLIALLKNGQPIMGAIDQPIAKHRCEGDNANAWFNKEEVCIRDPSDIASATLLATDIVNIARMHSKVGFDDLLGRVNLFRTWGDGFGYMLIARGQADIMLDAKMAPWDILPVIPVMRGAGAHITTFSGGDPVRGSSAICAHPSIHGQILRILNPASTYADTHTTSSP
jgi:histidinol phosphatase-like enzyme (inositol monophosphatase family)